MTKKKQRQRAERRRFANLEMPILIDLSRQAGLVVRRCTDAHYQIEKPDAWLLNVWPGPQKTLGVAPCRSWPKEVPSFNPPRPWCLTELLIAVIEADRRFVAGQY